MAIGSQPQWHRAGTVGDAIDIKRRKYIVYVSSIVVGTVLSVFFFRYLYTDQALIKYSLLIAAAGVWCNFAYVIYSRNLERGSMIASGLLALFTVVIVASGGYNNTALHWAYPLTLVQFTLLGAFRGAVVAALVLTAIVALLIVVPEWIPANYHEAQVSRAIAALTTLLILGFVSEYLRHRSHQDLSSQHTDKMIEAVTDPLTGLTNRRFIDAFYLPECIRQPHHHFPLAVLVCDVDHFKQINDRYGHASGDKVLKKVAKELAANVRGNDVVSRIGGEEFLILAQRADLKTGSAIAEKLRAQLEAVEFRELDYRLTASFGVAVANRYDEFEDALKLADQRLYAAKHAGRNRVVAE